MGLKFTEKAADKQTPKAHRNPAWSNISQGRDVGVVLGKTF